jgi:murein DD-endopeptidase MepM/ murein hydrolase activator NlpD
LSDSGAAEAIREHLLERFDRSPQESLAVAIDSLRFLGNTYRMSRELFPGYIDCSTLVSQAHWDAAGVQTPFVAESQRLASTAIDVSDIEQALPGDVLVYYPSLAHSPARGHNHVALLLTRDGGGWVIEARPSTGTRIIPLSQASWDGGIRRFCPNPTAEFPPSGAWRALALETPKIARLGARLTADYFRGEPRYPARRHRGVDVYAAPRSPLFAPVGGTVSIWPSGERRRWSVTVAEERRGIASLLAPVCVAPGIVTGTEVTTGDYLGDLDSEHCWYGCNALITRRGAPHLHWELWSSQSLGYPAAPGVGPADRDVASRSALPYNPIYAVKLGAVASPMKLSTPPGWTGAVRASRL